MIGWDIIQSVYETTLKDLELFILRNTLLEDELKVLNMRRYIREENIVKSIESIQDGPELNLGFSDSRLVYAFKIGKFELLRKLIEVSDNCELHNLACDIGTLTGGIDFVRLILLKIGRFHNDALRRVYMYPKNMETMKKNKDVIRLFSDNGANLSFLYVRCGNPYYMRYVMDMGASIHSNVFTFDFKDEKKFISLSQMIGMEPSNELHKRISQEMSGFQSKYWDEYLRILRQEFWFLLFGSILFPSIITINYTTEFDELVIRVSNLETNLIKYMGSFIK